MNKYSQFGEEDIIRKYFPEKYVGGCIDVGASDGVQISNTRVFEEEGWYCLCVEPNPRYFNELKYNRKNAVEYAISDKISTTQFNVVNLGYNIEDAVSSLKIDEQLLNQFRGQYTLKEITVNTLTLDECIKRYYNFDKIDFISIDTEGTELDVLKGFDINKWKPRLLIIENNFNDSKIEQYLQQFNYIKTERLEVNDFYINKYYGNS